MHYEAIASALFGGAATAWLAKTFITRTLKDLGDVADKVQLIREELAVISKNFGKMDQTLDRHDEVLHGQASRLAVLETKISGWKQELSPYRN